MLSLNPEELQKWKQTFAKDGIVYDSDDDYREAVHNLVGFFEVLIEMDKQQKETPTSDDNDPRMHLVDKNGIKILL